MGRLNRRRKSKHMRRVYLRLWRRRLRHYIDPVGWYRRLVYLDAPPKKIAISFAVGVYIAFVPLLGVQTMLSLAAAWLFRLNAVATVSGSLFTNPVTFVPLLWVSFHAGMLLHPFAQAGDFDWSTLDRDNFLAVMKPYIVQLFIGLAAVGLACAAAAYLLTLFLINRYRERNETEEAQQHQNSRHRGR
ncbi:DUF2062 domain-containing protein [Desulfurispira natronophila]|uniref:DUF2062 domain-containing protein n=1 Tax=Desulfurispira natronophila TaxID=682562 RepID=A0A7W7Y4N6_9BACT|nr:DUF2062 domain-containing protein [Desulfurispira natronophila]MBB5022031.1 hypothetical protein [Desulfurispira natronophila]